MRILVLMVISLSLFACKLDLEDEFHVEKIPAYNILMPDNCVLNTETNIPFDYNLPNACYEFFNIEYDEIDRFTRIITPYAMVENSQVCTDIYREETYNLNVTLTQEGVYRFKFWTGETSTGITQYEERELVIN